jgi:hypothetical protein
VDLRRYIRHAEPSGVTGVYEAAQSDGLPALRAHVRGARHGPATPLLPASAMPAGRLSQRKASTSGRPVSNAHDTGVDGLPLLDSDWDYGEATLRLKAHRAYERRER